MNRRQRASQHLPQLARRSLQSRLGSYLTCSWLGSPEPTNVMRMEGHDGRSGAREEDLAAEQAVTHVRDGTTEGLRDVVHAVRCSGRSGPCEATGWYRLWGRGVCVCLRLAYGSSDTAPATVGVRRRRVLGERRLQDGPLGRVQTCTWQQPARTRARCAQASISQMLHEQHHSSFASDRLVRQHMQVSDCSCDQQG